MKNIKEEIKRIKSLFSDDRLYGNILNEATNPDSDKDGKIDATEFSSSGDEIDSAEAELFLKDLGISLDKDVESTTDLCMQSPNMKSIVGKTRKKLGNLFNTYNPFVNASTGVCYLSIKNDLNDDYKIKKMALWNDEKVTFYITLKEPIDFSSVADLDKSMPNLSSTNPLKAGVSSLGRFLTTKKINYLRYFADIDISSWTYKNVEFGGFYDENLKRTAKPIENTVIEGFVYNPGGTSVDVDITQILTNGSYCNINLNGSVDDLLGKI
jgi:hypothetical protein